MTDHARPPSDPLDTFKRRFFYHLVCAICQPALSVSRQAVTVGLENINGTTGPFLVAANHTSPYDIALLLSHSQRHLDFVSSTEAFKNPFTRWLYGGMNAFPLDRSRPDAGTVRTILERLRHGRVVAMFPEGGTRTGGQSVLGGGGIRRGLGRICMLAQAPVIPVVIVGSEKYSNPIAWLPFRHTRYGIFFGNPIPPPPPDADEAVTRAFEVHYIHVMRKMHGKLLEIMKP
jgi:1-acyl-sn-glycerol-3-phosphate acyltransferase